MTESLTRALRTLRDVDGVIGSFVLHRNAGVRVRDLPQHFDAGLLDELGPRLERLREAWDGFGAEPETTTLAFAALKLHVRKLDGGFLCALSGVDVNTAALRMALMMVARRVDSEPPPPGTPTSQPSAPDPEPRAPKRSFFGRRR